MNKRKMTIATVLVLVLVLSTAAYALKDLYLNDIGVDFDLAPTNSNDLQYVPLESMADYYGFSLDYDWNNREIYGRWGNTQFLLKIGSRVIEIKNQRQILDRAVVEINGHILAPVEFYEALVKRDLKWQEGNSNSGPIIIIGNKKFTDAVDVIVYTNKNEYKFGQQVAVTMVIKNTENRRYSIPMNSSQIYDLVLSYKGYEIWRWSKDKMFTQAMTDLVLEPNETKVYTFTLPTELVLTPADYQLEGYLVSNPQISSDPYTFEVK